MTRPGAERPPGATGLAGLARLRPLQAHPIEVLTRLQAEFGDVAGLGLAGPLRFYAVFHPDGVEHVLAHNHKGYGKGAINAQFRILDGEGLVTAEGDLWVRQRRLAQPAFHRKRLAAMATVMGQVADDVARGWRPLARDGALLDVIPEMMRLTLRITTQTLLGMDVSDDRRRVGWAVDVARDFVVWRMYHPWLPEAAPAPGRGRFLRARRTLDELVYGIIRERRRSGRDAGDLLSMLLVARDEETGEGLDDQQLRDQVMTMLMAGHETTAVSLGWILHLLATHPEVQERLHAELDRVLDGRRPGFDDLAGLAYTRMVVEEALRLYPPIWAMTRVALAADEVGGYRIPRGAYVCICPYVTHRHGDFWADPERFDPERFDPGRSQDRHRFAYFPFGGGPHKCIGHQFAMVMDQLVLATLASRYRMTPGPAQPLELEARLSLRPRQGIRLRLDERGATLDRGRSGAPGSA